MTPFAPSVDDVLTIILLVLGLLSLVFSRLEPGTRAAGGWGAGVLMLGLGYALLEMEGRAPVLVSVAGAICMLSALGVIHRALRAFEETPHPIEDRLCWVLVALASVVLLGLAATHQDGEARLAIFSAAMALLLGWAAVVSIRLPVQFNQSARLMFTGLLWCAAALFVACLLLAPQADARIRHEVLQPYVALIAELLAMSLTLALMWMEVSLLNARLATLAARDALTGLLNHRAVLDECAREFSRTRRYQTAMSLAMLDIDFFKRINDERGHLAGDAVLRHLARLLGRGSRKQDVSGRYGGEEFLILMPQTALAAAVATMDRMRHAIDSHPCRDRGATIPFTVSIGVAELSANDKTLEELIHAADLALYRAKDEGRNRVRAAPIVESEAPAS